jgi:hypothetical protein
VPWSVVVDAISLAGGGDAGSYALNVREAASMYANVNADVALHWASNGMGKPVTVRQTHGWTCGPAKTGPPIGWFVIVRWTVGPCPIVAITSLAPTARPVMTPS